MAKGSEPLPDRTTPAPQSPEPQPSPIPVTRSADDDAPDEPFAEIKAWVRREIQLVLVNTPENERRTLNP